MLSFDIQKIISDTIFFTKLKKSQSFESFWNIDQEYDTSKKKQNWYYNRWLISIISEENLTLLKMILSTFNTVLKFLEKEIFISGSSRRSAFACRDSFFWSWYHQIFLIFITSVELIYFFQDHDLQIRFSIMKTICSSSWREIWLMIAILQNHESDFRWNTYEKYITFRQYFDRALDEYNLRKTSINESSYFQIKKKVR